MTTLAFLLSLFVAGLGALGVVSPNRLLDFSRRCCTPAGILAATLFRIAMGVALFFPAPASRAPAVLRVIGIMILVAGISTPLLGPDRTRRLLGWWSARDLVFQQLWGACAFAFGTFWPTPWYPDATCGVGKRKRSLRLASSGLTTGREP